MTALNGEHAHRENTRPQWDDGSKLTVDYACEIGTRCVWPGRKQLLTRGGNTAARWEREPGALREDH